jgi:hypothetical protein
MQRYKSGQALRQSLLKRLRCWHCGNLHRVRVLMPIFVANNHELNETARLLLPKVGKLSHAMKLFSANADDDVVFLKPCSFSRTPGQDILNNEADMADCPYRRACARQLGWHIGLLSLSRRYRCRSLWVVSVVAQVRPATTPKINTQEL